MNEETITKLISAYNHLKTTNKELISSTQNGYLGTNTYQVTLNDNSTFLCEQITKNHRAGHAVVILPLTKNNEIIIVLESRPNTKESVCLSFPAGMVDENEKLKITAQRELIEETGYQAENIIELESHYQDQGCSSALITTFLALNCHKICEPILEGTEKLIPLIITEEELDELFNTNKITDANSKIAYLEYTRQRENNYKQ